MLLLRVRHGYLVVFMFEEAGQGLDAGLQRRVLRLHLAAESGHDGHGRVQSVFVDEVAAVSDETQHAVQTAGLEHSTGLPGTDQLQHLNTTQTQDTASVKTVREDDFTFWFTADFLSSRWFQFSLP